MSKREHSLHGPGGRPGGQVTGSRGRALDGGTLPPGPAGYPAVAHDQDLPLPRRTAGNAPGGARIPRHRHSADLRWKPPNPDVLRRLLAGLRRLG